MSLNFTMENLFNSFDDAKELIKDQAKEVGALDPDKFEVDLDKYKAMAPSLRAFAARENGKLIGYSVFIVNTHHHYKGVKVAFQDVTYLDPAFRGHNSMRFINWCDKQLRLEGVKAITRQVTEKKDYSKLLEKFGYRMIERLYLKEV